MDAGEIPEPKARKARIGPIRAGEVILANPIREDLQDRYEILLDLLDAARVARSEVELHCQNSGDGPTPDMLKKLYKADWAHKKGTIEYWADIRDVYDNWTDNLHMRDGYVLVKSPMPTGPHIRMLM